MNLRDCIVAAKCRKGNAKGTTKRGAYWLACPPIEIRRCGGDGIGSNAADVTFYLELRHYRSGAVQASIHRDAFHQNGSYSGGGDTYETIEYADEGDNVDFFGCASVEDVVVALKKYRFGGAHCDYSEAIYSDSRLDKLTEALEALGLPACEPAPDA